jgi:hypothetical protein
MDRRRRFQLVYHRFPGLFDGRDTLVYSGVKGKAAWSSIDAVEAIIYGISRKEVGNPDEFVFCDLQTASLYPYFEPGLFAFDRVDFMMRGDEIELLDWEPVPCPRIVFDAFRELIQEFDEDHFHAPVRQTSAVLADRYARIRQKAEEEVRSGTYNIVTPRTAHDTVRLEDRAALPSLLNTHDGTTIIDLCGHPNLSGQYLKPPHPGQLPTQHWPLHFALSTTHN